MQKKRILSCNSILTKVQMFFVVVITIYEYFGFEFDSEPNRNTIFTALIAKDLDLFKIIVFWIVQISYDDDRFNYLHKSHNRIFFLFQFQSRSMRKKTFFFSFDFYSFLGLSLLLLLFFIINSIWRWEREENPF